MTNLSLINYNKTKYSPQYIHSKLPLTLKSNMNDTQHVTKKYKTHLSLINCVEIVKSNFLITTLQKTL